MYKIIFTCMSLLTIISVYGIQYCFKCRSRGNSGTCKDPFVVNKTILDHGVKLEPCISGWCLKISEGKDEDYAAATERQCLPKGPSDSEERCSKAEWNRKKVYMCFCKGDLCNSSTYTQLNYFLAILPIFRYILGL